MLSGENMLIFYRIIFGLCIGVLAGYVCLNLTTKRIAKGPNSTQVRKQIYYDKYSEKYYQFEPITHVCPPSINIDELEHSDSEELIMKE